MDPLPHRPAPLNQVPAAPPPSPAHAWREQRPRSVPLPDKPRCPEGPGRPKQGHPRAGTQRRSVTSACSLHTRKNQWPRDRPGEEQGAAACGGGRGRPRAGPSSERGPLFCRRRASGDGGQGGLGTLPPREPKALAVALRQDPLPQLRGYPAICSAPMSLPIWRPSPEGG